MAKKRKKARKAATKRPVKKRKSARAAKSSAKKVRKSKARKSKVKRARRPKEGTIASAVDVVTDTIFDAGALRSKLAGRETFED